MTQGQSDKTDIRLDKWLWAARFYKTRAIAKEMINGGKVHYNGQRAKSSRNAEIGAVLKIRQGYDDKEIVIKNYRNYAKVVRLHKNCTKKPLLVWLNGPLMLSNDVSTCSITRYPIRNQIKSNDASSCALKTFNSEIHDEPRYFTPLLVRQCRCAW